MIFPGNIFFKKEDFTDEALKKIFFQPAFFLVFLNLIIYLGISFSYTTTSNLNSDIKIIKRQSNLSLMHQMHIQAQDPIIKDSIAYRSQLDPYLFVKDTAFWKKAQTMNFVGDQIQIDNNKKVLSNLNIAYESSAQKVYGLGHQQSSVFNWMTYQFTHLSFFHFLSNVVFLFLVVGILQKFVSAYWIVGVYIFSGIAAGVGYFLFSDQLSLPLIGASGSVSGLMVFLCVIKAQQNVTWSYFVSPLPSGHGNLLMPAYLIFPIYILTDFTKVLLDVNGVTGSVAHSAHIGGALSGFALGLGFLGYRHFMSKYLTT